ncbi:TPA: DUF4652 domain-containing protein [Clostridium botulinum]|uniref:DUF4652 domain-containing protein n=1 Tax=Clostridium botulinum TaxID=1491 RepID=UPI000D0D19C3|nr:DUF4652 domain-containing protein [Clostridium botulinum]PSL96541.1 DUF4652 domain-containing protein [Clostridium botulinum]HDK7139663.1 DUF4652 domain-containing protein [Clostridium botulinum]HDK7143247.1 DUF4652 domain-containing protein [Clostridium botulinum]HDK7146643.1 DUF4652 domain-containing protein [Clostridium botulinum]HDK7150347.1 DUF4652 domain-containing protein [Clostridium botulinum]
MLKNKKIALILITLIIFSFSIGCTKENKSSVENIKQEEQKVESNNNDKEEKDKKNNTETKNEEKKDEKEVSEKTNFSKVEKEEIVDKKFQGENNTEWKESEQKKYSAIVEGKGNNGEEEGIGKVYLKENNTNKLWLLKINEIKDQKSPKFLYWIDDENLLVIIGHGYGTVSKGGNLYCINVKNDTITPVYEAKDNKHEVISAEKVKDNSGKTSLILTLNVYEDDNFIKSHKEKITISNDKVKEFIK